jgi:hypothetical protein
MSPNAVVFPSNPGIATLAASTRALGTSYISQSTGLPSNEFLLSFPLMCATTVRCNPREMLVVSSMNFVVSRVGRCARVSEFLSTAQNYLCNEQPMGWSMKYIQSTSQLIWVTQGASIPSRGTGSLILAITNNFAARAACV